ncbi:FtsX-like permease family protein [Rhodobacterales bacterium HKCCE3408]|nr:FtsX-like permease family protein [Rhodobacterales bacterium HKCCE3408]
MTRAGLSALLSHWRQRPGQLAALVLGLMLATALWSGVQAINAEARNAYDRAEGVLTQGRFARLARADGGPIPVADYVALRRAGYLVSPVIETDYAGLTLLGLDPLTAPADALPGGIATETTGFADFSAQLYVSPESADQGLPGAQVLPSLPPGTAVADISTVARLTGVFDPTYLLVLPDQPAFLPPIETATDLELRLPDDSTDPGEMTAAFHMNLTAFGLLSFGVGLFIAHAAIGLAVEQRRPVIRTLRALGLPLRRLIALLALELLGIAAIAGILGVLLGYVIAAALLPGVAGTLRGLYGAPIGAELGFDPAWALAALAIALIGAGVAGASALWRVAHMPILAPALPRAWAMDHGRILRRQALAAAALFALAALFAAVPGGLVLAFASLAALLLGAALALPPVLSWLLSRARPLARGAFAEWVLADTRQQVSGLSLALMALLLALAANVGVSTMVGSFRETFVQWLDQRLGAELYLRASNPQELDRLTAILGGRTDAILPVASVDRPLLGQPGSILAQADDPTYRERWPLLDAAPDAFDALHAGTGVFVNEQIALREGLSLGDPVPLAPGLTLPVVAIYADYGNPEGQAVMGLGPFRAAFPDVPPLGLAIRADPDAVPGLIEDLRAAGLPDGAISDQANMRRISLMVFERTFRVTDALSALTLGVAGLAILLSFLTLARMRLPQLAPVWAIGQTRTRLAGTELGRSLALAALTFLLALPVGLALAWLLLNRVNTEAFGWRLPMILFPGDWLRLALLAALAAGLAATLPALRLARMAPARLLQVFVHER